MIDPDQMAADAQAAPRPSDLMDQIVSLAEQMEEARATVDSLTQSLADAKEKLREIEREDLPTLMEEIGLSLIKLADGSIIEIKKDVDAYISKDRKADAHQWLIDNGFGGLIKTEVAMSFDRGAHEEAAKVAEEMADKYGAADLREAVHAATLKSFVKERLEAGEELPAELFGVFPFSIAKLKRK